MEHQETIIFSIDRACEILVKMLSSRFCFLADLGGELGVAAMWPLIRVSLAHLVDLFGQLLSRNQVFEIFWPDPLL